MAHTVDATGLACPLPVLRARKAIKSVAPGEILEVVATDPASVPDFAAFCEAAGHQLVACEEAAGIFSFRIRKAG